MPDFPSAENHSSPSAVSPALAGDSDVSDTEGFGVPVRAVPDSSIAFLLRQRLAEQEAPLVHVARDDASMAALGEMLEWLMPEVEVLRFPAWDCLPYDRASPNPALVAERAATLSHLLEPAPRAGRIVLTTVHALLQRVPPQHVFAGQTIRVTVGEELDAPQLAELLVDTGYTRVDTVMERGEFASRGGIFDLFPADGEEPIRLEFFGDEVEKIRHFDPATQRSTDSLEAFALGPVSEYALDRESIGRFRAGWRDSFGTGALNDTLYQQVIEGRRAAGAEHYLPLFHESFAGSEASSSASGAQSGMATLLDYVPGAALSFERDTPAILEARLEMIADHYQARLAAVKEGETPYRPLPPYRLYLDREGWKAMVARHPAILLSPFGYEGGAPGSSELVSGIDAGYRPTPLFAGLGGKAREGVFEAFGAQVKAWAKEGRRTYVTAWSRGSRERIAHLLAEHGIETVSYDSWPQAAAMGRKTVGLVVLGMERGFVSDRQVFVSEQDLLGERLARPPRRRRKSSEFITQIGEITAGDLVVHEEYGIGRYVGLETVTEGRVAHDYLSILYDGEQRLLLPVENIDLLSRFGAEQEGLQLDRLGGTAWQARKAKMKTRLREMAGELIRTAAARAMKKAPLMAPAEGAWDEFCARFPFVETEDQMRAIAEVLEDMNSGVPMDRLVCGDVGFGKTEVALRAAFVAAMSGRQVAVVVPTTLLARQHFRGFSERFEGLPVKVAQLSRMVTPKEAENVRAGLADGSIDIVIGTHALLSKHVSFDRLGLLIIDEEQHFGVSHKEKLKAMREDVHVLTLSATPLPRTLQLSLSGVREMSLIATPPTDRLSVRTFITPFDRVMIREAIQRERFRGGQVFCVVPRLADMGRMAERLKEIVPDARIAEAHGRLSPTELESVMSAFSEGKYDILLSTNIVESGLDMPGVNTIIIHRADMFGLGQLYQLRGRVGRGKQRGYAYLTWPQTRPLSASSLKRLEVMQTLDSLGAGFTLASHDLDMRGAGNLLGEEQSGHIREVGIELYQQMLQEAVSDLRRERGREMEEERGWTPTIILGLPVLLPEAYVPDLSVRLGLYRRIASLQNEAEVEAMRVELVDRFGTLPPEVETLLEVVLIKKLCRETGVERLETGPKGMVIQFRQNRFADPEGLMRWVARNQKAGAKVRPDQKLAIVREMTNSVRIKLARKVLGVLQKMVRQVEGQESAGSDTAKAG
ncbi:transcription-repair coupling factor [Oecophyllibacter saccharovorans]|uniref:transcription-repair coupling factor n=1 Tax=Oecophyllibacter saccharovorans TaxID=2558360 RepID=UPI001144169F|nr:transcription-repair coupling factor [Oecophyllibacter saccharovorans]QDH15757.1 transcription-repair coupling factor [Oecophyllibacter saccharovorans]